MDLHFRCTPCCQRVKGFAILLSLLILVRLVSCLISKIRVGIRLLIKHLKIKSVNSQFSSFI